MDEHATHVEQWRKLPEARRRAWSGFLVAHAAITRELDAELERASGLSLRDYDVLVRLGQAAEGGLRMHELADAVRFSRSGLTRLAERLEHLGLVRRRKGVRNSRMVFAVITELGLERLAEATPDHLKGVRERFLDLLSDEESEQMAGIWDRLLAAEALRREAGEPKGPFLQAG